MASWSVASGQWLVDSGQWLVVAAAHSEIASSRSLPLRARLGVSVDSIPVGNWNWQLATLAHWQHFHAHIWKIAQAALRPPRRAALPVPAPRTRLPRLHWELRKSTFDFRQRRQGRGGAARLRQLNRARPVRSCGVAVATGGSISGDRNRKAAAVSGFERLCRFCRKSILPMGRIGKAP